MTLNRSTYLLTSIIVGLLILLGCGQSAKPTPTPGIIQVVPTATFTSTSKKAVLPDTTPDIVQVAPTATSVEKRAPVTIDNANQIIDMAFSPNNKLLAVAVACGGVILFELQDGGGVSKLDETKQDTFVQFEGLPHMMAFTADSNILMLSSNGEASSDSCVMNIVPSPQPPTDEMPMVLPSMTSRSDTDLQGAPEIEFQVLNGFRLWELKENGVASWGFASGPAITPAQLVFFEGVNLVVEFSSDSTSLYGRSDGHSYVWEFGTSDAMMNLGSEELNSIDATTTFNPDATIKAVTRGQDIVLARTTDNQVWHVLQGGSKGGHQSQVTAIMFSRDGNTLFSASEDGQVIIWGIDIAIGQHFPDSPPEDIPLIWNQFSLEPGITSLELSFDQSILAIGYADGSIITGGMSGLNR